MNENMRDPFTTVVGGAVGSHRGIALGHPRPIRALRAAKCRNGRSPSAWKIKNRGYVLPTGLSARCEAFCSRLHWLPAESNEDQRDHQYEQ